MGARSSHAALHQDTGVFVIGCIPFLWATWEFWRRIAVGASFGTGKDAVVFDTGDDADDDQIGSNNSEFIGGDDAVKSEIRRARSKRR